MATKYRLIEDADWQEWRLVKAGASYAESAFAKLEEAIAHLPEIITDMSAFVEIISSDGKIQRTYMMAKIIMQAKRDGTDYGQSLQR